MFRKLAFPERIRIWKLRLARAKNAAYAWRQMVLLLSLVRDGDAVARDWLPRAQKLFASAPDAAMRVRFAPAMAGLERVVVQRTGELCSQATKQAHLRGLSHSAVHRALSAGLECALLHRLGARVEPLVRGSYAVSV